MITLTRFSLRRCFVVLLTAMLAFFSCQRAARYARLLFTLVCYHA